MSSVVSVDPFKCRLWKLHDRFQSEINEQTCAEEIESFKAHGQIVPALGRRLADDEAHEVELIYGARRLFAARHLNLALRVELREFTDREALVAMDIENRQRRDISPYERGLSYRRWLQSGKFASQDDISKALKISASQVSRLLRLACLPAVVVNAFRSASEIRESWGLELLEALEDPQRRAATIRAARLLTGKSPRLPSQTVLRRLLASSANGRKPKAQTHDKVVLAADKSPLFRIRYLKNAIALIFDSDKVPERTLRHIESLLISFLRAV